MKAIKTGVVLISLVSTPEVFAAVKHQPVRVADQGSPIAITVGSTDLKGFTRATLYFRNRGAGAFQPVAMIGSGRRFQASISAFMVRPPGVEYYIEAIDVSGQVVTYPANSPLQNPVFTRVRQAGSDLSFRMLSPAAGKVTSQTRPVLSFTIANSSSLLDPASLRLSLDEADITSSARTRGSFIQFRPPVQLKPGRHDVRIEGRNLAGQVIQPADFHFFVQTKSTEQQDKKKQASGRPRVV